MQLQYKTTAQKTQISLSGDLTIYHVSDIKKQLLDEPRAFDKKVFLDLKEIEEIDTSGVQLLLMLRKMVMQKGGTLTISEPSEATENILESLNCSLIFNLKGAST